VVRRFSEKNGHGCISPHEESTHLSDVAVLFGVERHSLMLAVIRWPRPRPERDDYERAGVPQFRWPVSGPGASRPYGLQVDGKRGVHLLDGLIPFVRIKFYRAQQDRLEIDIYIPVGFDARE
jgi:hypothetical protein